MADRWMARNTETGENEVVPAEMIVNSTIVANNISLPAEEREALAALPDEITIYRGIKTPDSPDDPHGMSWTLDRDKAVWFANRMKSRGVLYTATIKKSKVLAHFLNRGESEIVVHPDSIIDALVEPV